MALGIDPRTSRLPLLAAALVLAACGGGESPVAPGSSLTLSLDGPLPAVAATESFVVSGNAAGEATLDSVVVVYDGQRRQSTARAFEFTLTAVRLGTREVAATAYSRDVAAPVRAARSHTVTAIELPALVSEMFAGVDSYIHLERLQLEDLLPRNPGIATFIQEKIALLGSSALPGNVALGHRFRHRLVTGADGRARSLAVVFVAEPMREEAGLAAATLAAAVTPLEQLMNEPYPLDVIPVWYGFTIGARAQLGTLMVEDLTTYMRRRGTFGVAPHDALLVHELAHSYVAHEQVARFLELYAHNVLATGSTAPEQWTWTAGYVPLQDSNSGVHAVLDIYRVIGREAMTRALVRVRTLEAPYGQPLAAEAQQAFVDEAPASAKSLVAAKAARIGA